MFTFLFNLIVYNKIIAFISNSLSPSSLHYTQAAWLLYCVVLSKKSIEDFLLTTLSNSSSLVNKYKVSLEVGMQITRLTGP